jgi:hypothetical protein
MPRGGPCSRAVLLVTWRRQALYGEVSKPTSIAHSIRHKVQKLLPDDKSQLAIVSIVAEEVIRPYVVASTTAQVPSLIIRANGWSRSSQTPKTFTPASATA